METAIKWRLYLSPGATGESEHFSKKLFPQDILDPENFVHKKRVHGDYCLVLFLLIVVFKTNCITLNWELACLIIAKYLLYKILGANIQISCCWGDSVGPWLTVDALRRPLVPPNVSSLSLKWPGKLLCRKIITFKMKKTRKENRSFHLCDSFPRTSFLYFAEI